MKIDASVVESSYNPYTAPGVPPPVLPGDAGVNASTAVSSGTRLLIWLLDGLFMIPWFFAQLLAVGFLLDFTGGELAGLIAVLPPASFGLIMIASYYLPFELVCGTTPARFLTGTRLRDFSGARPRAASILLRTLCRVLPPVAIGSVATAQALGWHDRISGTRVVRINDGDRLH